MEGRGIHDDRESGVSEERRSASEERRSASEERRSASEERRSASEERRSASEERQSASEESRSANEDVDQGSEYHTMSSASVALTRGRHADRAKHKTGYDSRWEAAYMWVFYVEGEGMYCKLCRKFDTKNRQNQSKVWNKEACTTIRKDV